MTLPGGLVGTVSQTVGYAAIAAGAKVAGQAGFNANEYWTFDGGPHIGIIAYSFGVGDGAATKVEPTSTGVAPTETSYALYGHIIPLSLGKVRIGGDIIAGPFVENGKASFCISFGVPADPYDSRTLTEIAFDSEVVWENGSFNVEAFTFRYYPGTLTQAADALETSHFGADAVAYRPQILLWFENLPLANTKFQKIPYVAAVIVDSTAGDVNLGYAFEALAYSPWVGYTSADFETIDVTDGCNGIVIAQDAEFLSTIQQFNRFYKNWNILQTDKLRIVDRGATVAPDITLDRTTLKNQIIFARGDENELPRLLELTTIDPDADYTIVPSTATRPREPVNVSAAVQTESVYLPMVMDSFTRQSLVTYTKYQEETARKKVTATAMMYGSEIEPGDLVEIGALGANFQNESFKVLETTHGADYSVEFTAEAFLKCGVPGDPYFTHVVLLLGFEDVDDSQGAPGFTDESPAAHGTGGVSSGGGLVLAYIDTAQFKFGTSSLHVFGQRHITFPDSNDWRLASSNSDTYTVECWVRFNTIPATTGLIVGQTFNPTNFAWVLETRVNEFAFRSSSDGSTYNVDVVSSSAALTVAVWYHLAVDKDASGKIRIYKNGVMMASATPANSSIWNATTPLLIGNDTWFTKPTDGWVDELRITKGVCRYGSDGGFPVPTSAYPRTDV